MKNLKTVDRIKSIRLLLLTKRKKQNKTVGFPQSQTNTPESRTQLMTHIRLKSLFNLYCRYMTGLSNGVPTWLSNGVFCGHVQCYFSTCVMWDITANEWTCSYEPSGSLWAYLCHILFTCSSQQRLPATYCKGSVFS